MTAPPARFADVVAEVLRTAGWEPDRREPEQAAAAIALVGTQIGRYGARLDPFVAAVEALTEFCGLYVEQGGPGRDLRRRPFCFEPAAAAASAETLSDLGRLLDTRLFPIGVEADSDAVLAIDQAGRVFALDPTGAWHLGDSIDAAITTLITGIQPTRLDSAGGW